MRKRMETMNSKTAGSLPIGYFITLLLCLIFLIVPFHKALATESEEEKVAKLVEEAKKEGKLLLYTTMSVVEAETLMKRFNEKYPFIETGVYRTDPDGMITRITTESQAKRYLFDLVHLGTGLKDEISKRKGFTVKYLSPQRQFYAEVFKDPEGYSTDMYVNFNVLGYDTNLVSSRDAPKTYEDLLNPKWKGKMGMDAASDDWFAGMVKMMGEKKA